MIFNIQAQSLLHTNNNKLTKDYSRIEMPVLRMSNFPYPFKEINFDLGDYLHFNYGHLPFPIIDASVDFWKAKPTKHWPSNHLLTNEDMMRLPAVNTYDIIKILDKDRMLTNW